MTRGVVSYADGLVRGSRPRAAMLVVAAALWTLALGCAGEVPAPVEAENNTWHEHNDSDTVLVFVHGILSDSRSGWFDEESEVFWPDLVLEDELLGKPSIFLAGYYTALESGDYSIRDAANDLYRHLTVPKAPASEPVLAKKRILFIAHSTGGIVVRHMLVRHDSDFERKTVGLMLMASPSIGSEDASRFDWLSDLVRNRMSRELQWDNPFLEELDGDFKNLVYEEAIPCLRGVEAIENHLVVSKWFGLWRDRVLVEKHSGGRYFKEPQTLPDTDHFSIVKPDKIGHPAHLLLQHFFQTDFSRECRLPEEALPTHPVNISSLPSGAEVRVDGELVGTTPLLNFALREGTRKLEFRLSGHVEQTLLVEVPGRKNVSARLVPVEPDEAN